MHDTDLPLMPPDLPPLSDASVVEILEFLQELVCRFENGYFAQIQRFYHDRRVPPDQAPCPPLSDDDLPF